MATTTAWLPYRRASVVMSAGSESAAVFRLTLSAPASTAAAASPSVLMPPPTARGMNSSRATARIVSASARRSSIVAVMSRMTSSSMPSRLYRRASSAGSPADRRPSKFTPLTTWPLRTSRQAMMRLESIVNVQHKGHQAFVFYPLWVINTVQASCAESAVRPRRTFPGGTARPRCDLAARSPQTARRDR